MITYTTTQKVRDEAWFTNNTNITDTNIDDYRIQANGRINTIIGQKYTLPLSSSLLANSPAAWLLDLIEKLLAAGYLLWKEYWPDAEGTDKDGISRINRAEDMLKQILTGELKLIDNTGWAFNTTWGENLTISWYPNDSTDRKFSIKMKF